MTDFNYNWTANQMRSWVETPEPDWDGKFLDGDRLRACLAGLGKSDETRRVRSLIEAYWGGRLTTADFISRFEAGMWPAGAEPDAPYGTDREGRTTQVRVEHEAEYRKQKHGVMPALTQRLAIAEVEARKRFPEAFNAPEPNPDGGGSSRCQQSNKSTCNSCRTGVGFIP